MGVNSLLMTTKSNYGIFYFILFFKCHFIYWDWLNSGH